MSLGTEYLDPLFEVLQDFKENVNQPAFLSGAWGPLQLHMVDGRIQFYVAIGLKSLLPKEPAVPCQAAFLQHGSLLPQGQENLTTLTHYRSDTCHIYREGASLRFCPHLSERDYPRV